MTHALTLRVDDYGNVLQAAAIGYGRRYRDPDRCTAEDQAQAGAACRPRCTESAYTNAVVAGRRLSHAAARRDAHLRADPGAAGREPGRRHQPVPLRRAARQGQLRPATGITISRTRTSTPTARGRRAVSPADRADAHALPPRRLGAAAGDARRCFRSARSSRSRLPGESYKLAFTPGLLVQVYQRGGSAAAADGRVLAAASAGGWRRLCRPRRRRRLVDSVRPVSICLARARHVRRQELADAAQHFFLPRRFQRSVRQRRASVDYDADDLLAAANRATRSATRSAAHERLPRAPARAGDRSERQPGGGGLRRARPGGRHGGHGQGRRERSATRSTGFAGRSDAAADRRLLRRRRSARARSAAARQRTTRIVYDVDRFSRLAAPRPTTRRNGSPPIAATIARETHVSDLAAGRRRQDADQLQLLRRLRPRDPEEGAGRARAGGATSGPVVDPRWVGSGWTIFNNKGKPVRQYEPFFSRPRRPPLRVRRAGRRQPDPVLRPGRTRRRHAASQPHLREGRVRPVAAGSLGRQRHGADRSAADPDVGGCFARLPAADYLPTWYAQRSAGGARRGGAGCRREDRGPCRHAARCLFRRARPHVPDDRRQRRRRQVRGARTISTSRATAPRDRRARPRRDALRLRLLGTQIHQASMDAGERWMLERCRRQADPRLGQSRSRLPHRVRRAAPSARHFRAWRGPLADPRTLAAEVQYEKMVYGEGQAPTRR